MMIKMSIYDICCAELIHTYVELHFEDFCKCQIEDDLSELEYTVRNHIDFQDWAECMGYKISLD